MTAPGVAWLTLLVGVVLFLGGFVTGALCLVWLVHYAFHKIRRL